MRNLPFAVWTAGCVVAIGIEGVAFSGQPGLAAADLAVAVAFLTAGLFAWRGRRQYLLPLLFLATGLTWSLGTLAETDVEALAWLGSALLYVHRGPLAHLLLAYPTGRLGFRLDRVVVAGAYVDGLVVSLAEVDALTLVLMSSIVIAGALGLRAAPAETRAERGLATACAALVGTALVFNTFLTLSAQTLLLGYEAALIVVALALALGLQKEPSGSIAVTDLVVELGAGPRSESLRERLARALGDPSLEVGFWVGGSLVDGEGGPVSLPMSAGEQVVTAVERDGRRLAVIVHDAAVSDEPALGDAIDAAARLAASNARLHAELRVRVAELERSRRRVVEAADAQRRRLERRLRDAADVHLQEMRMALARARAGAPPGGTQALAEVERELDEAVVELHDLASGIHPRTLTETGLLAALSELAANGPVSTRVAAPAERFPAAIEVAAYFVCSEALANVAKYAEPTQVSVEVAQFDGHLRIVVADDGVGGADPTRGSGLRGLADRVQALGGRLRIRSPESNGTTIMAELPLREHV